MNNKVNCGIMFATGLVLGLGGGYFFAKKKYEVIANEEIESAKEAFNETNQNLANKLNKLSEQAAEELLANKGNSPMDYINKINQEENESEDIKLDDSAITEEEVSNIFVKYGGKEVAPTPSVPNISSEPIYVITPDEYGELDNYNLVSLTLTKDGYLLDDHNEVVDDPLGAVGDTLVDMGKYEDDAIHVRNDIRQCDYEVLQDNRTLADIQES